jgi:hypothetical protein
LPIWRQINRLKWGNAVTSSSDFGRPTNLGQGVEALRAKWGWIVALGIIYLLVGVPGHLGKDKIDRSRSLSAIIASQDAEIVF